MDFLRSILLGARTLVISVFAASASSGVQAQTVNDQDSADWSAALAEGTAAAFQRYLERHPTGRHASEAFACTIEAEMCGPEGFTPAFSQGVAEDIY